VQGAPAAELRSVGRREIVEATELNELSLQFQLTTPDGPLETYWNRLLNVVADFQLVVGRRMIFSEEEFPIVELAVQLDAWLERLSDETPEFVYTSSESQIPGLIRFSPGSEGWHVSAAFAEFADATSFNLSEVATAVRSYVAAVDETVSSEYGFRLRELAPRR